MRVYHLLPWLEPLAVLFLGSGVRAQEPGVCFGDDGQYRSTSAGTFLITCGKRSGRGAMGPPNPETKPNFAACIDACATRTGCKSVDYNADTLACTYLGGAFVPGLSSASGPMVHNARLAIKPAVVDPPPANPSDTPTNPSGGSTNPSGGSTNPSGGGSTNPSGTPADQSVIASPSNFVYTQDAKCAGDNNKVYVAGDGTYYRLQCNYQASRTLLSKPIAGDLKDCMEKCSAINGCLSVMFNARPPIGSAEIQGECSLFGEGDAATQSNEQHDFAYAIDPPAQDVADFPNQLCTTACPFSDGMTYASEYGENFKMDCGKRHGGTILSMGYTDTLTECMDNCAKIVACHSVDYQARTKKCYYGTHHGNPTIMASGFDSAHSVGCANACGGGCGCCTSKAPSKGIDPPKTLDTSCGNQGLAYAIFPNTKTDGTVLAYDAPAYSTFDPTVYKTANPQVSGQTTSLGVTDCHTIYGNTPNNYEYVTVNHRGYIFAAQSGEHTFSFTSVDNIVMFWLGPKAYSGYTRANADIIQPWVAGASSAVTFKTTFVQGQYYPIRIIFANGGGPGNFKMSVQAPDGTVVVDDATGASKILVQFSCDGVSAPPFPAFGAELAPYPGLAATEACPALDQQFRIVDGRLYKIFCSAYGTGGSNFENTQRSLQDCLKACTADARCNEIDFVGPATSGMCYLKSISEAGPAPSRLNQGANALCAMSWPPKN